VEMLFLTDHKIPELPAPQQRDCKQPQIKSTQHLIEDKFKGFKEKRKTKTFCI